eukprot:scaffold206116_cov39-Tisochrysis_lutea.AAC.4
MTSATAPPSRRARQGCLQRQGWLRRRRASAAHLAANSPWRIVPLPVRRARFARRDGHSRAGMARSAPFGRSQGRERASRGSQAQPSGERRRRSGAAWAAAGWSQLEWRLRACGDSEGRQGGRRKRDGWAERPDEGGKRESEECTGWSGVRGKGAGR